MNQKELPEIENLATPTEKHWLTTWFFFVLLVSLGLGFDWDCAFEWFCGRYSVFSAPVLGLLISIVVLYVSISFLAGRLWGEGTWREVVGFFAFFSFALGAQILWWWDDHRQRNVLLSILSDKLGRMGRICFWCIVVVLIVDRLRRQAGRTDSLR